MADHKPMIIRMPNERGGQSADVIAAKRLAEACKHLHELARADERIPDLLATPAAVRFVSAEPLLGHIEFLDADDFAFGRRDYGVRTTGIDWVIAGSESGPGARPCDIEWVRSIRDQCQTAVIPFFFKQMNVDGKLVKLPSLDGREWREFPA